VKDLGGKVAIVTGGNRGIGSAIASGLAVAGARVAIVSRDRIDGERAAENLSAEVAVVSWYGGDTTVYGDMTRVVEEVVAEHGRIDILVGSGSPRLPSANLFLETDPADYAGYFVRQAVTRLTPLRAVADTMIAQGKGKVVFLTTDAGRVPTPSEALIGAGAAGLMFATRAIARELGLADDPKAYTGQDLDDSDGAQFSKMAREGSVFARTSPEHKLRLVESLQSNGDVIAMTGDGVNDAPALKRADVGVAMGRKGTEAAKEASEMVLADDNFASIVAAVREGRTVYDNLTKVIAWTLPTNGGEAFTIILAIAFGLTLPVTAIQILWINMVTAVALGLTLAFEPTEAGTMARPPRRSREALLSGRLLWRILFVSALMVVGTMGVKLPADG
jgi:NADP-dependent 3-hydroxy acid dehydrogenase YdfG